MPWGRLDDGFHRHPKRRRVRLAVDGLLARAISVAADDGSDGYIHGSWVADQFRGADRRLRRSVVDQAVREGLLEPLPAGEQRTVAAAAGAIRTEPCAVTVGPFPEDGYLIHDYLDCNPSHAELVKKRLSDVRRQALFRDSPLREAIRSRDAGRCRYCDAEVNWQDRRGHLGGTYDHLDPDGPNTMENLVVACRGCNSRKRGRTPMEADMPVLPPAGAQLQTTGNGGRGF